LTVERSGLEKRLSDDRSAEEELQEQLKSSQKPKYRRDQPPLRPALYEPTEHLDTEPAPSTSGHFYPRSDLFSPLAIDATMEYSDIALWATFETPHPSQLDGSAEFTGSDGFIPPTQGTL